MMDKKKTNNQRKYGKFMVNAPCKRHPKHEQSPGVCSICLSQRLSQYLIIMSSSSSSSSCNNNNNYNTRRRSSKAAAVSSSSSSSISYISSNSSSSSSSPVVVNYTCRMDSDQARKSIMVFKNVGQNVLKKSRSMAFAFSFQRRRDQHQLLEVSSILDHPHNITAAATANINNVNILKRGGFWSKLLMPITRNNYCLKHSKTMRESILT